MPENLPSDPVVESTSVICNNCNKFVGDWGWHGCRLGYFRISHAEQNPLNKSNVLSTIHTIAKDCPDFER